MKAHRSNTAGSSCPSGAVHSSNNSWSTFLLSLAVGMVVFGVLYGPTAFWQTSNGALFSLKHTVALGLALALTALTIAWRQRITPGPCTLPFCTRPFFAIPISALPFFLLTILWFFADPITRPFAFLYGLPLRGEILVSGVIGIAILRWRPQLLAPLMAILSVALVTVSFLTYLDGRLIISDDHASFFYRVSLLKEYFPNIPFYNTDWNGGFDARDFFATGALSAFAFFLPLSLVFSPETAYNLTVVVITWLLPAVCIGTAAYLFTRQRSVACWTTVLALGSGLIWYRWGLAYGTLGFATSCAFLPLVTALLWRAVHAEQPLTIFQMFAFVACWTIFLLWPGSTFMLPPILLFTLFWIRKVFSNRRLLVACALLVLINVPWMLLFAKVSKVASFVTVTSVTGTSVTGTSSSVTSSESPSEATKPETITKREALGKRGVRGEVSTDKSLTSVREQAGSAHPLIVLLLIPGLALLPRQNRLLIGAIIGYLVLAGTVLAPLKPHLELERLALVALLFATIPAALAFQNSLDTLLGVGKQLTARWWRYGVAVIPLGLLVVSPFVASSVATNRTILQFHVEDEIWRGVAEVFRSHAQQRNAGRILFAGFLLHELDGGHAAPLPVMTGAQAIASSQFHNLWTYRQVFPKSFIERGDPGINEYIATMNVSTILAHERQWRDYFLQRPEHFSFSHSIGKFSVFSVRSPSGSFIHEGQASSLDIKRHQLSLTPVSESVTLRFVYFPFLQATGNCTLTSASVAPELTFIRLENCEPNQPVTIQSISPVERLLQ